MFCTYTSIIYIIHSKIADWKSNICNIAFYSVYILCTQYSVHCGLYTVLCTLCSCTLCSVHFALYTVLCTLCSVHCALYTVFFTLALYTLLCTLCSVHCVLYTVLCIQYTLFFNWKEAWRKKQFYLNQKNIN